MLLGGAPYSILYFCCIPTGTVPSSSYTLTGTTGGGATTGSGAGQFINSLHSSGGLGQLASPSSSNATANFSPRPISVENSGSGGDMSSALNVPEMPPIPESIPIMPNTHTLVAGKRFRANTCTELCMYQ